jgi:hypothetical protein
MAKPKSIRGVHANTPLLIAAERMIETRLSEMLAYESYVANQEAVSELHKMRIAAKRLRYTLEIFQDAYSAYSEIGPQIKATLREIEQIQEHLGTIHDADVLVPQLNQHLAHLVKAGYGTDRWGAPVAGVHDVDYDACLGLIAVCRQLRAEREKTYDKFLDRWQKLQGQEFFATLRQQLHAAAEQTSITDGQTAIQTNSEQTTVTKADMAGMDGEPVAAPQPRVTRKRTAETKIRRASRQPVGAKATHEQKGKV